MFLPFSTRLFKSVMCLTWRRAKYLLILVEEEVFNVEEGGVGAICEVV
jgi:hypothetical protein